MSERPRILLTGPIGRTADYADAARAAGWDATELPLVKVTPTSPSGDEAGDAPDWIAVTSSNALDFLSALVDIKPDLARVPCAVVGARSAERVHALGLSLGLPPAEDASALGQSLIDAQPHGGRALWPRGPKSTELGDRLRSAGWQVEQPLAYESAPRTALDALPRAQAIFFASPSAVRLFAELYGGTAGSRPGTASAIGVAIGRTTFDALLRETTLDLCDTISLPDPAPEALRVSLEHLGAR